MDKKGNRDAIRAARVKRTSEITGVSERHVNRVMIGDQENDKVVLVFMELKEGENKLMEEVKKLVPFNKD